MLFDLPTLLSLRVGIDVLIALAFWAQMRRYPAIGGPGWWSLSSVLHIVGSTGLLLRGAIPDALNFSLCLHRGQSALNGSCGFTQRCGQVCDGHMGVYSQ